MIYIYNTKTHTKELFVPISDDKITMYVCGPTVYDYIHIGNARSLVCFDVIYRLLSNKYNNIIYVRNITDVDDKIIQRANASGMYPKQIAEIFTAAFHKDVKELNCLPPTHEPKATEHIKEIISLIQKLLENGSAYISNENVYFDITKYEKYGQLSNRNIKDLDIGIRVNISLNKKNPADFVLWKPEKDIDNLAWNSPWGLGRPGWHIECSAMSMKYLGKNFDIHGGGIDLLFPHHENELAQTVSCDKDAKYANFWIHNGFLSYDGEKMSKSIGNVLCIRKLIEQNIDGEIIRFALLSTHYRKQLEWHDDILRLSKIELNKMYASLEGIEIIDNIEPDDEFMKYLSDDINTPGAISILHNIVSKIHKTNNQKEKNTLQNVLYKSGSIIGIFSKSYEDWFSISKDKEINDLIIERSNAKNNKQYTIADEIRKKLQKMGIQLFDNPDGTTTWRKNKD